MSAGIHYNTEVERRETGRYDSAPTMVAAIRKVSAQFTNGKRPGVRLGYVVAI